MLFLLAFALPVSGQQLDEIQVIDPDWSDWPDQDSSPGPGFGSAIAADGIWLVVGAPAADTPAGEESGAIFAYRKLHHQWSPVWRDAAPLNATQGPQAPRCGHSVAIVNTGDVVKWAFGCPFGGEQVQGMVGTRIIGAEGLSGPFSGPQANAEYGTSVSLTHADNGTIWLAIGSPNSTLDGVPSGSVRIWRRDEATGNWTYEGSVQPTDPATGDRFGHSVSISAVDDNLSGLRVRLAVGAPTKNLGQGAAYVFGRASGGEWNQIVKVTADNGQPLDQFGASVAYRTGSTGGAGSMLAVGARLRHTEGNINLDYRRGTMSIWRQTSIGGSTHVADGDAEILCTINCSHLFQNMAYGAAVAIDGNTVWIGAPDYDDGENSNVGRVFGAERINGHWLVTQTLSPGTLENDCGDAQSGQPEGRFGTAIARTQDGMAVGYPRRGCDDLTPLPPVPRDGQVRLFGIADAIFRDRFQTP